MPNYGDTDDFIVICDETNNSEEDIDNRILNVGITLIPRHYKQIDFIVKENGEIEFQTTPLKTPELAKNS